MTSAGASVVKVGITSLSVSLGDGSNTYVSITNGSGLLVITAAGVAASFQL